MSRPYFAFLIENLSTRAEGVYFIAKWRIIVVFSNCVGLIYLAIYPPSIITPAHSIVLSHLQVPQRRRLVQGARHPGHRHWYGAQSGAAGAAFLEGRTRGRAQAHLSARGGGDSWAAEARIGVARIGVRWINTEAVVSRIVIVLYERKRTYRPEAAVTRGRPKLG